MSNFPVDRLWNVGWTKTTTGDGTLLVDGDGVLSLSAGADAANRAYVEKALVVRGGDKIEVSVTGRVLSGSAFLYLGLSSGGGSPLSRYDVTETEMMTHTIRTAVPMSVGEETVYLGLGFGSAETGSAKFHTPRIIADAILPTS